MTSRKSPIVLAHGLVHPLGLVTDLITKDTYFRGLPKHLRSRGFRVLEPKVASMGCVETRARELKDQIESWDERDNDERVVIIGHSYGGLDARYLISQLNGDELVETLVTIGTPHRGCSVADFVQDGLRPVSNVAEGLNRVGLSLKAIDCLTLKYMEDFNRNCADSGDVKYFSVSGQKGCDAKEYSPTLRPCFKLVSNKEGPNDGIVSVSSSRWGKHLGIVPIDHLEQLEIKISATAQMYKRVFNAIGIAL